MFCFLGSRAPCLSRNVVLKKISWLDLTTFFLFSEPGQACVRQAASGNHNWDRHQPEWPSRNWRVPAGTKNCSQLQSVTRFRIRINQSIIRIPIRIRQWVPLRSECKSYNWHGKYEKDPFKNDGHVFGITGPIGLKLGVSRYFWYSPPGA